MPGETMTRTVCDHCGEVARYEWVASGNTRCEYCVPGWLRPARPAVAEPAREAPHWWGEPCELVPVAELASLRAIHDGATGLARAVVDMVDRGALSSRSPVADALLDYAGIVYGGSDPMSALRTALASRASTHSNQSAGNG